jgi:5-methylcytosine-specific restriction endonuclease McrA
MISKKITKKQEREIIFNKYNGKCAYCGLKIDLKDMQIDHVIPQRNFEMMIKNNWRVPVFLSHLTLDDLNHKDNLNPTCRVCNKWKDAFDLETFRSEIFEQIDRLNKRSSNYRMAKKYGLLAETLKPIVFYFERVRGQNVL